MFRIVPYKKKLNSDLNVDSILEDFAPEHAVRVVKVEQVGEARLRRRRPLSFPFSILLCLHKDSVFTRIIADKIVDDKL